MRVRLFISGRVQGVYFRESMRHEAENLQVAGWVKNLEDGRVEAMLDGAEDAVRNLIGWCQRGPVGAKVEDVQVNGEKPAGPIRGFRVVR